MSNSPERSLFDFDEVADNYEDWYESRIGRTYDRLEKQAIRAALGPVPSGKTLLSIGCGTGHFMELFKRQGFSVTGIDVSEKMINLASARSGASARYALADGQFLPFANGAYDVACAITALEFVPDAKAAIMEMARCVKPGGCIIVGVLNRVSLLAWLRRRRNSPIFRSANLMSKKDLKTLLGAIGDASVYSTTVVLPWPGFIALSGALSALVSFFGFPFGDFLIGIVKVDSNKEI
ncbi:class I SAM-dependent methyltransferase [bacterium]|nr:class I SAM-dependent methyltransferase [bacterium]